ncbi:MAG: RNA polymerase sigma-70 factor [Bacteroidota bacterium]
MNLSTKRPDFKSPTGFKALYEQYAPKIYRYALSLARDEDAANEVVQEVFVTLWEKKESISVKGELEPYLVKLAKYKVIDTYRKEERLKKLHISVQPENTNIPTPEDHVAFEDTKMHIFSVFRTLPKKAQKIFFLSRKKGWTNKRIAKDLQISEKTVEYHIKKSLTRLKTSILR